MERRLFLTGVSALRGIQDAYAECLCPPALWWVFEAFRDLRCPDHLLPCYASRISLAKRVRATLPPLTRAPARLPSRLSASARTAAAARQPYGSTTIFICCAKKCIISMSCASLTVVIASTLSRMIGKLCSPRWVTTAPSAMECGTGMVTISPLAKDCWRRCRPRARRPRSGSPATAPPQGLRQREGHRHRGRHTVVQSS